MGALKGQATTTEVIVETRGELPRGDVVDLLGSSSRTASRVVFGLIEHHVVKSEISKAPLHIYFPAAHAAQWMLVLFPEQRR